MAHGNRELGDLGPVRRSDRAAPRSEGISPSGCCGRSALGVAGSLIGGFFATHVLQIADDNNFDFGSFLIAVAASFLLLAIWEPIARRRESREGSARPL